MAVRGIVPGPGPPFASGINATRKRETLGDNLLREQRGPGVVSNESQLPRPQPPPFATPSQPLRNPFANPLAASPPGAFVTPISPGIVG